jgi:cell division protein FtsL
MCLGGSDEFRIEETPRSPDGAQRHPGNFPAGCRLPDFASLNPGYGGAGEGAMMRILHICVIVALVLAAADVYKIKFESTRQAQRIAKVKLEIRREQDAIAVLRAEWAKLDNPARIQELAKRHLALKAIDSRQFDRLDHLPERPPELVPADEPDPIGAVIAHPELIDRTPTASVLQPRAFPPQANAMPGGPKR